MNSASNEPDAELEALFAEFEKILPPAPLKGAPVGEVRSPEEIANAPVGSGSVFKAKSGSGLMVFFHDGAIERDGAGAWRMVWKSKTPTVGTMAAPDSPWTEVCYKASEKERAEIFEWALAARRYLENPYEWAKPRGEIYASEDSPHVLLFAYRTALCREAPGVPWKVSPDLKNVTVGDLTCRSSTWRLLDAEPQATKIRVEAWAAACRIVGMPWALRSLSDTPSAYESEDSRQSLVLGLGKVHLRPAGRGAKWRVCHDSDLGPLRLHEIDDASFPYWTRLPDETLPQLLIWQATGLYMPAPPQAEQAPSSLVEWGCALLKRFPSFLDCIPEEDEDVSGQYQCDWIDQQLHSLHPAAEFPLDMLDDCFFEVCQLAWPDGFHEVVFAIEAADRQHADYLMWEVFEKIEERGFSLLEEFCELDDPHEYFIECFCTSIRAWRDAVCWHFEKALRQAMKTNESGPHK